MPETRGNQSDANAARARPSRQQAQEGRGEFRSSPSVRTALIEGNTFRGKPVQYVVLEGLAVFEGDIILGTEQQVAQKTQQLRAEMTGELAAGVVITGTQFRWPNCTIPYTIDSTLPNQSRVSDAIAHWQANTSFRFVARTNESDYVTFRPGSGCSSNVGKQGNQQFVNLGSDCATGNVIHEIGHVVGLWHEQSRQDRDAFVTIHWDKIQAGYEHNFNQHITDGDDVGAYDYVSIMHYPRDAFSVDGTDTITPTNSSAQIGQRTALSAGDISTANSLCATVKPPKPVIKDTRWDTRKEMIKDLQWDTRKELLSDTRKEVISDPGTLKEMIKDRIKEVALDPVKLAASDLINPAGIRVTPVLPVQPGLTPGGKVPFAIATPHQAPAAGDQEAELQNAAANLDGQLALLAEQLLQAEATREMLQAQYNETAELLRRAIEAHDQPSGQSGQ